MLRYNLPVQHNERMVSTGAIRTPDQRLRIFVSSTLRELESERQAVRSAIEEMWLAPVMFELGARPHPPRELYRSYLAQSDVFVGIYADSYGWVAPGEEISGLEDEYRLATASMPKLIYLREPATRDERLSQLIRRIQDDDVASYKTFSSPAELAELVRADLAVMLAERFDASRAGSPIDAPPAVPTPVPAAYTRIIGREREVAEIRELLDGKHRLVTLLGPGGVGKSRLAIEVAESTGDLFPDGTVFVALENVLEPGLLLPTIAYAVGIRDTGELRLEERIEIALRDRRMLLVLDNFEQLVDAAPVLVQFYALAPSATLLVTSRTVLRVRGERVYDVPPLATPDAPARGRGAPPDSPTPTPYARVAASPAVELFVERARAVKPDFELTPVNAEAVAGICQAVDGLPLAIELAAARMRVLTPLGIMSRLDRQLALLVEASRDLPQRQRTLRSTIEWSTELLSEDARLLLFDLGVFSAGFSLEAVETIGIGRPWHDALLDALAELVDSSLVAQEDQDGEPIFSLLATVREYAIERLDAAGDEQRMRAAHAAYYTALAHRIAPELAGPRQRTAARRLTVESGNLRVAVRHLVQERDAEAAADLAWELYLYWWLRGYFAEVKLWMQELLGRTPSASPRVQAIARFYILWSEMWHDSDGIVAGFGEVADLFREAGDEWGVTMARATTGLARSSFGGDLELAKQELTTSAGEYRAAAQHWGEALCFVALGRAALVRGDDVEATETYERALAAATVGGDTFSLSVVMHHIGRVRLFAGDRAGAREALLTSLQLSVGIDHDEGVAYSIEGLCALAALEGDLDRAGVLAGAAETIRQRVTMVDMPQFVFHPRYLDAAATTAPARARLDAAIARGREYSMHEVAAYAAA